jgi:glycosyltransferase involved in cell wall biosynthesis
MRNDKINITFFTPTLQKTGSELVLFNLLNYLPDHFNATVVCKFRGELYYTLPKKIKKDYIFKFQYPTTLIYKIYYKLFKARILKTKLNKYKNSVWYINTIVLPDIIEFAVKNNIRVIVHVHELQQMYSVLSQEQLKQLISYPELIIANSNASKSVLDGFKASSDIKVCYPAIATQNFNYNSNAYKAYRKKINIDDSTFVWTMVGSIDENKNPKLFIDIALELKKENGDFKLLWIGSSSLGQAGEMEYLNYAKEKGVSDFIIWKTNVNDDYLNYFNCADGFVLTSNLESFSLVTLEALLLGLPVVANNCVGVNEILNGEYGKVIDNCDALKMSEEMRSIMDQTKTRDSQIGRSLAEKFDIMIWQKVWVDMLNEYMNTK